MAIIWKCKIGNEMKNPEDWEAFEFEIGKFLPCILSSLPELSCKYCDYSEVYNLENQLE